MLCTERDFSATADYCAYESHDILFSLEAFPRPKRCVWAFFSRLLRQSWRQCSAAPEKKQQCYAWLFFSVAPQNPAAATLSHAGKKTPIRAARARRVRGYFLRCARAAVNSSAAPFLCAPAPRTPRGGGATGRALTPSTLRCLLPASVSQSTCLSDVSTPTLTARDEYYVFACR